MDDVPAALGSLSRAINGHDPAAVAACFVPDYLNETPVHPSRGFTGRAQVRENWSHILAAVPDLSADLVRWGTSAPGGSVDALGGMGLVGHPRRRTRICTCAASRCSAPGRVRPADVIRWTRFYMEEVDAESIAVPTAVERTVGSAP